MVASLMLFVIVVAQNVPEQHFFTVGHHQSTAIA
jgi:hypothetical protein